MIPLYSTKVVSSSEKIYWTKVFILNEQETFRHTSGIYQKNITRKALKPDTITLQVHVIQFQL